MSLPPNLITDRTAKLPGDLAPPATLCSPLASGAKRKKTRTTLGQRVAKFSCFPGDDLTEIDRDAAQRTLFERHDEARWTLRLPLSPSMNNYWETKVIPGRRYAITHISSNGRAYRVAVAHAWREHWRGSPRPPLTGRLRLLVSMSFPTARRDDLDNHLKPLQDALTACGAWLDDSQIDDLRAVRAGISRGGGYMDVTIEVMP